MRKKVLAPMLALAMVMAALTGCTSENSTDDSKKAETTEKNDAADTSASEDSKSSESSMETRNVGGLQLPLCEEKEELSVWLVYGGTAVKDLNDIKGIQKMEENTNVHINWTPVALNEINEKLGIMLTSGDYPDIIYAASSGYPGGISKGIEDGVIVDNMDELIRAYMPNYMNIINTSEEAKKEATDDSGKMTSLKVMVGTDTTIQSEGSYYGMAYRQDLMEKYNLEVPLTVDGWHDVLVKAKDAGIEIPFELQKNGGSYLSLAWGVNTNSRNYFQVDGDTVVYAPMLQGFGDYLETMRQWYSEGLIDPNFTSWDIMANANYVQDNKVLLYSTWVSAVCAHGLLNFGQITNEEAYLQALGQPVLNEGDKPIQCFRRVIAKDPIYITTSCKNPELAAKWLDYQYSDEGCFLNWYGTEGESWTYGADGTPQFTELITNNPDGLPMTEVLQYYALNQGQCWLGKHDVEAGWKISTIQGGGNNLQLEAVDIWSEPETNIYLTESLELTDEEAVKVTQLQTALTTMVEEYMVNYILGNTNQSYTDFRSELEGYGTAELTQIYQDAYDRYLTR